jgi:hypothetical protein
LVYSWVVPHSGQNFAVDDSFEPHSEQNLPSEIFSRCGFPYILEEFFTAPDGT